MLSCETCGKIFKTQRFLNNHLRTKHKQNIIETAVSFQCGECAIQFNKSYHLLKHLKNQHKSPNVQRCFFCPKFSGTEKSLYDHEVAEHRLSEENVPRKRTGNPAQVEATTVAVNNRFKTHCLKLPKEEISIIDPFNFLVIHQQSIMDFIDAELQKVANMKIGLTIAVDLVKPLNNDKVTAFFNSFLARIANNITDEEYLDHVDQLMSKLNVFASCGSGWVIESLQSVEVRTATCQTLNGSSYIEMPNILKGLSKSLLKVKNKNNFCFLYCVAAALFAFTGRAFSPKSHKENVKQLKFNSSRMPMPLSSIQPFEKRNNVSINVYQLENGKLVAVFYSKNKNSKRRVNLLRLVNGSKTHYCLIKNFSNLLQRLTRSEKKRKNGSKSRFCSNCFQSIIKRNYMNHIKFCESNAPLEIRMPISSPTIEFVNWQKTQKVPFVVYADLEAIDVCSVDAQRIGSFTKEIERQYPCSFDAILVDERS